MEAIYTWWHIKEVSPILFQFGGKEDPSKVQPTIDKLKKLGVPLSRIGRHMKVEVETSKPNKS